MDSNKQGELHMKILLNNKHGYRKAPYTQGLFLHDTRDISFTLVVDDFGIKYIKDEDVEHLRAAISEKYKFKVDMDGKQYIGIHLHWDYEKRELRISMNRKDMSNKH